MEDDVSIKRASFIRSSVEIRETFQFAVPAEVLKALKIHSNSFYGSSLWNLGGEVYSALNNTVKLFLRPEPIFSSK